MVGSSNLGSWNGHTVTMLSLLSNYNGAGEILFFSFAIFNIISTQPDVIKHSGLLGLH